MHSADLKQATDFVDFVNESPSTFHLTDSMRNRLNMQGFTELKENESWKLKLEKKYFVCRDDAALIAFKLPKKKPQGIITVASHSDSPTFKLHPHPENSQGNLLTVAVQPYGAPILHSWYNRDLGLCGRVSFFNKRSQVCTETVRLDQCPLTLPEISYHLNHAQRESGAKVDKEKELYLVAGVNHDQKQDSFIKGLLKQSGYDCREIICHELFAYPLDEASFTGADYSFISGWRMDNLASVFISLSALLKDKTTNENIIESIAVWDHEEIGSSTHEGAASPFFEETFHRICQSLKISYEGYCCIKKRSVCLSLDNCHAYLPTHAEKFPQNEQASLGQGLAVKFNANRTYAFDFKTMTEIQALLARNKLSLQTYINHRNIPTGTTIGRIHSAVAGIPTIDMGIPQLSMHSARELISTQDLLSATQIVHLLMKNSGDLLLG